MSDEKIEVKSIFDGKAISRVAMIISGVIILSYNIGYLLLTKRIPTVEEQSSILMLGFSIVGLFSPIYLSVILEKIFGKRS